MAGFNSIRHNCLTDGCYNYLYLPKVEHLARFLPRTAQFTDIDDCYWRGHATHIRGGRFLFLEWKSWPNPGPLDGGQDWFFRDLSALGGEGRVFVLCAAGDTQTMSVHHMAWYQRGQHYPWRPTTTDTFNNKIQSWGEWAEREWARERACNG